MLHHDATARRLARDSIWYATVFAAFETFAIFVMFAVSIRLHTQGANDTAIALTIISMLTVGAISTCAPKVRARVVALGPPATAHTVLRVWNIISLAIMAHCAALFGWGVYIAEAEPRTGTNFNLMATATLCAVAIIIVLLFCTDPPRLRVPVPAPEPDPEAPPVIEPLLP